MKKIFVGITLVIIIFMSTGACSEKDFSSNETILYEIGNDGIVVEKSPVIHVQCSDDVWYNIETNIRYTTDPIVVYALDGRTECIARSMISDQLKVGWYLEPVQQLYSVDGSIQIFKMTDVDAQLSVGWYIEPVQILYDINDNAEVFKKTEVNAQLSVGWYETPVQILYNKNGQNEIVPKSEVEELLSSGWYLSEEERNQAQAVNVNKNDVLLLARIIHAEAADDNYTDKCYVGAVVMNRVKRGIWGNSILSVVSARGQYSSYKNTKFNSYPPQNCIDIATALLQGERYGVPENVIYQSGGPQGKGLWKKIINSKSYSNHYYCYG